MPSLPSSYVFGHKQVLACIISCVVVHLFVPFLWSFFFSRLWHFVIDALRFRKYRNWYSPVKARVNLSRQMALTTIAKVRVAIIAVSMALTLLFNAPLIIIIGNRAELRTKRPNVYVIYLAVADILVGCITMPAEILFVVLGEWVFGNGICKLTVYLEVKLNVQWKFEVLNFYEMYNYCKLHNRPILNVSQEIWECLCQSLTNCRITVLYFALLYLAGMIGNSILC